MNAVERLLGNVQIPDFYRASYDLDSTRISNIKEAVKNALKRKDTLSRISKGSIVAITAGSRDIKNIDVILLSLIQELKAVGAVPFIVPAMGSHGGATAEGQLGVLQEFGITEDTMNVAVISSMETDVVGRTENGLPVNIDKTANSADFIIPVGRIKPHPEFRGDYESGLVKMMAIGLGKQHGANVCHQQGMGVMSQTIEAVAKKMMSTCRIPFGLAVLENALHDTYQISAVPSERILEEEPELLEKVKQLTPVVPFEKIDVLICEEMGKDISGTGMDSNAIGRSISLGVSRPYIERIGILDITDASHGNFNGVGLGDVITRKLFDKMSFSETYPNTITACEPFAVKIPSVMENDRLCVNFCIATCVEGKSDNIRIVWIRNTLSMDQFYFSDALLEKAKENPLIQFNPVPCRLEFDEHNAFLGFNKKD